MADDLGLTPVEDIGLKPVEQEAPGITQAAQPHEDLGLIPVEPDMSAAKEYVKGNLQKYAEEKKAKREPIDASAKPIPAETFMDGLAAGYGMSVTGLLSEQNNPSIAVTKDSGRLVNLAASAGQLIGDLPFMIGGAAAGLVTYGSMGAVAVPGIGAIPAGVLGAGAVGFGLPPALRKILMDRYEKGDITTSGEFFDRLGGASWEAVKGAVTGIATVVGGTGVGLAGEAVAVGGAELLGAEMATQKAAQAIGQTGGKMLGELGTMVSVSKALEGEVPNADDFINGGIVLAGFAGALHVAGKLRTGYSAGEIKPADIVANSEKDVILKQDILSEQPDRPIPRPDVPQEPPAPMKPEGAASGPKKTWVDKLLKLNDDNHDVKFMRDVLTKEGEVVPADKDPYIRLRMRQNTRGIVNHFLRFGTMDNFESMQKSGEGLAPIIKDIPDVDHIEVSQSEQKVVDQISPDTTEGKSNTFKKNLAYIIAKRVVEKTESNPRIKFPIDLETAKQVVAEGKPMFEETSKRTTDYAHRLLRFAFDEGLISREEHDNMKDSGEAYVPLNRDLEHDPFDPGRENNTGIFRKMKGNDTLKFVNPYEGLKQMTQRIVTEAYLNRAKRDLWKLQVNAGEGAPVVMKEVPQDMRQIKISKNEIANHLEQSNIDSSDLPDKAMEVYRPDRGKLAPNEFSFKENGKTTVISIHEDFADAAKVLQFNPKQIDLTTKTVMDIFKLPAKMLRTGTAISPDFIFNNAFKDQIEAGVQSRYGKIPFADMTFAIKHIMGESPEYQRFLLSGGLSGGLADIKPLLDVNMEFLDKESGGAFSKVWNRVKTPYELLELWSSRIENGPRFMEAFRSGGLNEGATPEALMRGGFDARNVTVDFDKAGVLMRTLSQFDPFVNAGMQATEQTLRRMKENPAKVTATAFAAITLPSLYFWTQNRNDSRYLTAPLWEKNMYWHVSGPDNWRNASPEEYGARPDDLKRMGKDGSYQVNDGIMFKLKKPYLLGVLFGSLPERVLDRMFANDKTAFKQFDETLIKALFPDNITAFGPTAITPVVELMANHSFFRDRPIVNDAMKQYLPQDRYSEYTSETAKQIAKLIGYVPYLRDFGGKDVPLQAPAAVDHLISSWGGTSGRYLTNVLDGMMHAAGVGNSVPRPAWQWADVPVIRAFVTKNPSANSEQIREFYDRYQHASEAYQSAKRAAQEGRADDYNGIIEDYGSVMLKMTELHSALTNANKALHAINTVAEKGPDGKRYDPDTKRQLMDTVYFHMTEMAKKGLQTMDDFQKQVNDNKIKFRRMK